LKDEFNQIKSKNMIVYLKDNITDIAKAVGNAQAITYADEHQRTECQIGSHCPLAVKLWPIS
jgi:hypothetical protein